MQTNFGSIWDSIWRLVIGLALLFGVAIGAAGCVKSKGFHEQRGLTGDSECPFDAAQMRLHPLTRFIQRGDKGNVVLHAHAEIIDAWGDTAKSLGIFRMELRRSGLREGDLESAVRWEVDLRDPATNSARFDRVTQTYLLRLQDLPAWVSNDPSAVLSATFVRGDGALLTSTLRLDTRTD